MLRFGLPYFLLLAAILISSCGSPVGQFAFKRPSDDVYRKPVQQQETNSAEELQWVCTFDSIFLRREISVIVQQEDVTWTEIAAWPDYLSSEKLSVFGTADGYPPGKYKIVIIENKTGTSMASQEFVVYEDENEAD